jgi:hypothetical protein
MRQGTRFAVGAAVISLILVSYPLALWYRGYRTRLYYDKLVSQGCRIETKCRCSRWWPDWVNKHISNPKLRDALQWPFLDVAYVYANEKDIRWLPLILGDSRIREVFLKNCEIRKGDLLPLNTLPRLDGISFVGSKISDEALLEISGCSQLTRVNLEDTKITSKGIQVVRNWPKLRRINLQGARLDEAGVAAFEATPLLGQLDLSYAKINAENLSGLRKLSSLKWLDLSGNPRLGGKCLEDIGHCKNLLYLNLPASRITDGDLEPLRSLENLGELHVNSLGLTGRGYAALGKLPELKELFIGQISDVAAEQISRIHWLKTLEVSDASALTDAGLRHLAGLKNLERLTLRKIKFSDQAWNQLRADLAPLVDSDCHTWGKVGRTLKDPKTDCHYPEMFASDSEPDAIFRRFP